MGTPACGVLRSSRPAYRPPSRDMSNLVGDQSWEVIVVVTFIRSKHRPHQAGALSSAVPPVGEPSDVILDDVDVVPISPTVELITLLSSRATSVHVI